MSLLFFSGLCFAQFPKERMYQAWLEQNMTVWGEQLSAANWSSLNTDQQADYLAYEYGYVASLVDAKSPDADRRLTLLVAHIDSLQNILPAAVTLSYRSACAACRGRLHPFEMPKQGVASRKFARQAYDSDKTHPLALNMNGCVDFYAPAFFGGDKQQALTYFRQSKQQYEQRGDTVNNWQYASNNMHLVMCLDKTGHTDEAITLCRLLLRRDTNFTFLRDTYLPQMLKQ